MQEKAAAKSRQFLLRFKANQLANYEALYQEPDPKYIYYIGQSQHFETWYESIKDDDAIHKDFEKESSFTKHVFEAKSYDKFSIWKYDDDYETEIKTIESMKNNLNNKIENLIDKLNDQKNSDNSNDIDKQIEEIENYGTTEFLIKRHKKFNYIHI